MLFLDPKSPKIAPGNYIPDHEIPKHVRVFGYVPDIDALLPGDLILFSPTKPTFSQRHIIKTQENGFSHAHAQWTHAAVYIGEGFRICDSQFGWRNGGVSVRDLYPYIGGYKIRIRRKLNIPDETLRWKIAIQALSEIGRPYGIWTCFRILVKAFWDGLHRRDRMDVLDSSARICSQLYVEAFSRVLGPLGRLTAHKTTPANLSTESSLSDVDVMWKNIGEAT